MPALHDGEVSFAGQTLQAHTIAPIAVAGADAPPVLVAALGPAMLKLAGQLADGTVTWMAGPRTLADHIVPSITKAASAAGRPASAIAVGLPVCVTANADDARRQAAATFALYGELPTYRPIFEHEQARGPADVAIVGDESAVASQLERLINLGGTEIVAHVFGAPPQQRRTSELLGALAERHDKPSNKTPANRDLARPARAFLRWLVIEVKLGVRLLLGQQPIQGTPRPLARQPSSRTSSPPTTAAVESLPVEWVIARADRAGAVVVPPDRGPPPAERELVPAAVAAAARPPSWPGMRRHGRRM